MCFAQCSLDAVKGTEFYEPSTASVWSSNQGDHWRFLPGIEVGGITWHGLSKLRHFEPAIPYCANGRRMVQWDYYSDDGIFISSPWKACSGDKGQLMLRSTFLAGHSPIFRCRVLARRREA